MSYRIEPSKEFLTEAKKLKKRYHSFRSDLDDFKDSLEKNPFQGAELSPGIRKIRMAIAAKGKGKIGGARVITYNVVTKVEDNEVVLVTIYDKAEVSSISKRDIVSRLRSNGLI